MPRATSVPHARALAIAAAERREREREAEAALGRVHGAGGLHAAILALLRPDAVDRAPLAWAAEVEGASEAAVLLAHARALSPATRLPWLERLARRMEGQPVAARNRLLVSTRRMMGALGGAAPLDRLQWLALRQWLGEPSPAVSRGAARHELAELPADDLHALAHLCGFLARVVPGDADPVAPGARVSSAPMRAAPHGTEPGPADDPTGRRWYDTVMAPWAGRPEAAFVPPDTDRVLTALLGVQSLGWMQRPMLLRSWVDAALATPGAVFSASAADALRLVGALLDSPLPPQLRSHFREPPPDATG